MESCPALHDLRKPMALSSYSHAPAAAVISRLNDLVVPEAPTKGLELLQNRSGAGSPFHAHPRPHHSSHLSRLCMTGMADTGTSASYAPRRDKEVELIPGSPVARPPVSCVSNTLSIVHWTLDIVNPVLAVGYPRVRNKVLYTLSYNSRSTVVSNSH